MDFRFTEDQVTLRDSVREYLEGTHTPELLRKLDEHGNRDPQVWNGLVEMGLGGLLVPEDQGGLGMGLVEAALIA
ncbi:MAG: acyl-CoA dehydrogenase family protein, partial [Sphingomonadaceae bacterium]